MRNISMILLFCLHMALVIILYRLSKNKYNEFLDPIDKNSNRLIVLFPIALFILEKIKYKYNSKYDKNLYLKISELSGTRYAGFYLCIHYANKIAYIILLLCIFLFLGTFIGTDSVFIIFGIFSMIVLFFALDKELDKKINSRRMSINLDFPDFLNKLILLINAGMTIKRALEKILSERKKQTPLYYELSILISDIQSGKSDQHAYEDFAKRCRISEVTKFVSIIIQNLKKGGNELISILRLQARDSFESRKAIAKRLGEEASTKMLLPMMIMFFAILLIVATPAILALTEFGG